jgi:hypothetical protein
MDLNSVMARVAEQVNGQYTMYDPEHAIIVVPVSGGRFQTVLGSVRVNELYNRRLYNISSKVCPLQPEMDFAMLLEQSAHFYYSRFVITEGYLQVEAVAEASSVSADAVGEMIMEVANLADQFEMKVTGADIH